MLPRVRCHPALKAVGAVSLLVATSACSDGWRLEGSKTAADVSSDDEGAAIKPPSGELAEVVRETEPSAAFMLDGKPFCFVGTDQYYLRCHRRSRR